MRGIPRQAVEANLPVSGSQVHAADIADQHPSAAGTTDMYGVDMSKPGAQEYYDSIVKLYAGWGVDFIKADDIATPVHSDEIDALHRAIVKTGRPIVLSLSPGPADVTKAVVPRPTPTCGASPTISGTTGRPCARTFTLLDRWSPHVKPGAWPDADMLPLGHIGMRAERGDDRMSRFTHDEQRTLMTLWSIARSPLMFGGDLPGNDDFTLSLLTNDEVLAVDQHGANSHQLFARENQVAWVSDAPGGGKFLGVFNTGEQPAADSRRLERPRAWPGRPRCATSGRRKSLGSSADGRFLFDSAARRWNVPRELTAHQPAAGLHGVDATTHVSAGRRWRHGRAGRAGRPPQRPFHPDGRPGLERHATVRQRLHRHAESDRGWRPRACALPTPMRPAPYVRPPAPASSPGSIRRGLHLTDWIPGRKQWPYARLLTPRLRTSSFRRMPRPSRKRCGPPAIAARPSANGISAERVTCPPTAASMSTSAAPPPGQPPTYFGPLELPGLKLEPGEFLTERLTMEGGRFLSENRGRPWFLYQAHFTVHMPLEARKDVIEKYRKRNVRDVDPIYCAMVESADDSVGRLLKSLDDAGLSQRTVVFFFSDNGGVRYQGRRKPPVTNNSPLRAGKGHLYEGGIREPLMVRWPGVTHGGSLCDQPVSSVDFVPTICEMTGTRPRFTDGVSLAGALRGGKPPERPLFWHYPHYSDQGGAPGGAVRLGDWKLIEFYEDGRLELFHLRGRPWRTA